jgi:hypothetical protein
VTIVPGAKTANFTSPQKINNAQYKCKGSPLKINMRMDEEDSLRIKKSVTSQKFLAKIKAKA